MIQGRLSVRVKKTRQNNEWSFGSDPSEPAGSATRLAQGLALTHLMVMPNDLYPRRPAYENAGSSGSAGSTFQGRGFGRSAGRGPVIDQDGREIPEDLRRDGFRRFRFDFSHSSANPFGDLTHEQRLARLDAIAKLLDVAFVLPGTNIRYGIDGIVRLIPVVGDLIASAFSLWLVREARALGAPWHVTARMLANVALEGTVGMVPVAGDAFDVMFRANMRNMRILRNWMDRQAR